MQGPRFRSRLVAACFVLGGATSLCSASMVEYGFVGAGNHYGGANSNGTGVLRMMPIAPGASINANSGAIDTGIISRSFTGLNAEGVVETETFAGRAMAQVDYGTLKVGASYSLTNRLANLNNPAFVNADFSVNPDGVPFGFSANALAQVRDSVTVGANQPLAYVEFKYHLTGTITTVGTGPDPRSYSPADNSLTLLGMLDYTANGAAVLDEWVTGRAPVIGGVAKYSIQMVADAGIFSLYEDRPVGRDSSGSVDFMHSLDLVSVMGVASDGSLTPLTSAVGLTGVDYLAITAVPEPQALALMLAGLFVIGWRRRLKPAARTR